MNQQITAIVVDDNPGDILNFKKIAGKEVEIIGEANSAAECLELLETKKPDVLFLDIEMPGMSGIELGRMIIDFEEPPQIAFISGNTGFAIDAFEISALDYVIKPFEEERILKTIEKVKANVKAEQDSYSDIKSVIDKVIQEQHKLNNDKLPVKDYNERTVRFLDPKAIVFAQRDSRKVNIYTEDETFPTYYTIDKLEARLKDHGFHKASSGVLINLNYVEHMIPNGDGSYDLILKLFKEKMITVSRSCSKEILTTLSV